MLNLNTEVVILDFNLKVLIIYVNISGDIVYNRHGAPPARYITSRATYPSSGGENPYDRIPTDPPVVPTDNSQNDYDYNKDSNVIFDDSQNQNQGQDDWSYNNGSQSDTPSGDTSNDQVVVGPTVPQAPVAPQFPAPPTPPEYDFGGPRKPQLPEMPRIPERFVPEWAKKEIYATGTGVYPEDMFEGQARAMARRAAQVDAYRVLGENALGVKLQGSTTIKDFVADEDLITARLDACFLLCQC